MSTFKGFSKDILIFDFESTGFTKDPSTSDVADPGEPTQLGAILLDKTDLSEKASFLSDIKADPDMLRIIFHNLLGNAIKFSNSGGHIHIGCNDEQDFINVIIRDEGVGMSSDQAENLFTPGQYHSTAGTANEPGSGLGLMLCKEMVEKMGGKIGVGISEGAGSTFWFSLPVG